MSQRAEHLVLGVILALSVSLGAFYSVVTPLFEASDELWHYPMVKTIADRWALPVQDPANVGPWRQEGSQPPLYYFLGALATFWIDTSDMAQVRHLNPHVDNGVATPDGNINLVVHNPVLEAFPWRGTVLAVHLVRLLSVFASTSAVYLTWLIVRELARDSPFLALGTASIHAFTPMVVFIGGAVNNDNLVIPLSNLALLMLLRLANERPRASKPARSHQARQEGFLDDAARTARRYLPLGLVLGLAVLTKSSSLALTAITAIVVIVRAVRRRSWIEFLAGGLATLLPVLVISGWWYVRNLRLYGDLTGLNVFIDILGQRDVPADVTQLWRERFSFAAGYWGNFGGLNVPMATWVYRVLNTVTVLAVLGLIVRLVRVLILRKRETGRASGTSEPLSALSRFPGIICLLWGFGVFAPWALIWASITWSSQGRLVFPAIAVCSLLLALGLSGWLPRQWGRWALMAFSLFLLCLSLIAPLAWIRPAYALPEALSDAELSGISNQLGADFGAMMVLLGYEVAQGDVLPGDAVEVTLYWEGLRHMDRDYTVFVHLLGEGELLVAQRDTFPGVGRLSTTWLKPGFRWSDRYVLQVPATAYTPDVAEIEVGLYDASSGARLPVVQDGGGLGDQVRFGRVGLRSRSGDVPNPVSVDFGGRLALVGYELDRRLVAPGGEAVLTLYWRGLRAMDENYTVSAQLVDDAQRKAAQLDSWPLEGAAPTQAWKPGELVIDARRLTIYPDTATGVYDVQVVVYLLEGETISRLPVIPEAGEMLHDHAVLTRVRVAP